MKGKYKWILLCITLLSIVALIIYFFVQNHPENTINNINDDSDKVYTFRIFEYSVPKGLKFNDYTDKRFKIQSSDWYAIVGLSYDGDMVLYNDVEWFQNLIKQYDETITTTDMITIDGIDVITFQKEKTKSLLCYFATGFGLDYEIEIYNKDGSYKSDALNEIVEPLLNVTYENDGSNDFYVGYFKRTD